MGECLIHLYKESVFVNHQLEEHNPNHRINNKMYMYVNPSLKYLVSTKIKVRKNRCKKISIIPWSNLTKWVTYKNHFLKNTVI